MKTQIDLLSKESLTYINVNLTREKKLPLVEIKYLHNKLWFKYFCLKFDRQISLNSLQMLKTVMKLRVSFN